MPLPITRADGSTDIHSIDEGIEDRVGTFETRPRSADDVRAWFDGQHPIVVVEQAGALVGFASTSTYRPRDCYAGIAEFSVYVDRAQRVFGGVERCKSCDGVAGYADSAVSLSAARGEGR